MDPLEYSGRHLGCDYRVSNVVVDNALYKVMTYDTEEFFGSRVERYEGLTEESWKLKFAPPPFIEDTHKKGPCQPSGTGEWLERPWCCGRYATGECRRGNGNQYLDKGCGGLPAANQTQVGEPEEGVLAEGASSVLIIVCYGARMARFDPLRLCHEMDAECDRKLHRLMFYGW